MINTKEILIETRESDSQIDQSGIYYFKDSGIGNSWLIGTDFYDGGASQWANAFNKGIMGCPEVLDIPRNLTDLSGKTLPVEIIGRAAFMACGDINNNGATKELKITRQVKVIRNLGLSGMWDLEKFEIEAGSELKTIEDHGMAVIGFNPGQSLYQRTGILILPPTLSTVYTDGIFQSNLFHTIIYCGSHILSNPCELETVSPKTMVKVTSQYPKSQNIFGRSPDRSSTAESEAENECKKFFPNPNNFRTETTDDEEGIIVIGWGIESGSERCPDNISIPEIIKGLPVHAIGEGAFENCTTSGSIVLPQTVRRIGARAFAGTVNVTGVFLPVTDSLEEIGFRAFWRCGANSSKGFRLSLPSNKKILIHEEAFSEADVEDLVFV